MEKLEQIRENALKELDNAPDEQAVEDVRVRFLGKKGELTEILRAMGQLAPEERPKMGQRVNEARAEIEARINSRKAVFGEMKQKLRFAAEAVDVTAPGEKPVLGRLHPITLVYREIRDIFIGMGFEVREGPEIELDKYNFEMLNIPKNHPARDMQDTFYVNENTVLRTHTSPVQVRTMLSEKPPIRILSPGRVFRVDNVDSTHSPVFHQLEGLVVDKNITMGDLKGVLDAFAKGLYGADTKTRLRPSYFPFTEPSAEVDVSCGVCKGKGCRVCKGTGWVEVLGSGMVNPKVLDMCGIDPKQYSGFAFGMGLDRIANMKYGVTDIRYLYENDARFLRQF
jgi:phenylalanyl-tRNA synthetase alpha chain